MNKGIMRGVGIAPPAPSIPKGPNEVPVYDLAKDGGQRSAVRLSVPNGQSFLPRSQMAAASSATNTRRGTMAFCSGTEGLASSYQDLCARAGFTMPMNVGRCRFRIRNAEPALNITDTTPIAITGIWWGTPDPTKANWNGDFTAAPTKVFAGAAAQDIGTADLVTPWFTPPSSAKANQFQGMSIGATISTDGHVFVDYVPGWTWHGATGVGASGDAGNQFAPTHGTAAPYSLPFDIRLEYEYVGSNLLGLFLGSSLTAGYLGLTPTTGLSFMGPDSTWPSKAAKRLGHAAINAGVGGGILTEYTSQYPTGQLWSRFDLGPGINAGVSCTPDYAVIDLGVNETDGLVPLTTFQASYMSLVADLNAIGIRRIFACTVPITQSTPSGLPATGAAGTLSTAIAASGSLTTINVTGPVFSTTKTAGPGRGQPGNPTDWYNASNIVGPVAGCTAAGLGSATTLTTTTTNGFASVSAGDMVTGTGIPQGTYVTAVNSTTQVVVNQTCTSSNQSLTFSPYGVWLGLPGSNQAEGPYALSGASGTTTLALTSAGTAANAHSLGEPVFAMAEGLRQQYNYWIRAGIPGVTAVIDLDLVSRAGSMGAMFSGSTPGPQVPISQGRWDMYVTGTLSLPHPATPGLYEDFAAQFAASGIGA